MAADCDVQLHNCGLDSTFWVHRKLFVKEVHELKESKVLKGLYQCGNHMILRVEVMGTIVCVDVREKLIIYGVDDGTGVISCCHWKENKSRTEDYCLGQLVTVQGKLSTFRGQRQITVNSIVLEDNPNAEILFWLDAVKLNKEVYSTPFVIPAVSCVGAECSSYTEQLMQFLRKSCQESGHYGFSFRALNSNPRIQEIAQCVIDSKYSENDQSSNSRSGISEVSKVVRQVLSQLEIQGDVCYKDAALDYYEIITYEHHLKPTILKAIKDISKGSPHEGAHIARISDVLRSSQSLCRVSSGRVLDSLKKLICDSEIYQQSGQVYCIV